VARLGALLAVVMLVPATLVATRLADLRAQLAQLLGEVAAPGHVASRQAADCGAVHVQRDASRHHLDVLLLQAGRGAVVTGVSAGVARLDAGLVLLVSHLETPSF
tara:strand:+ start:804 stop:1118 length:315 start_codon:yes stop_codon:yes gene_type:complete